MTVGFPFPKGVVGDLSELILVDFKGSAEPLQTSVLATWPDGSVKWGLFDFQATVQANTTREMVLKRSDRSVCCKKEHQIRSVDNPDGIIIDTGPAIFTLSKTVCKPFTSVLVDGKEILNRQKSRIALIDDNGTEYEPVIDQIVFETDGLLRKTLKADGWFYSEDGSKKNMAFFSRISFFAGRSIVKIEFSILNPNAAEHRGGLWDLGDPGSLFFSDLSINTAFKIKEKSRVVSCRIHDELGNTPEDKINSEFKSSGITIYQDSSGGENWKSKNHVNHKNEVRNTFQGFKVFCDGVLRQEGKRANPVLSIQDNVNNIEAATQHFWQNFPKALEGRNDQIVIRLFPKQYDDLFELQGGEQKTHTVFIDFNVPNGTCGLDWINHQVVARTTPEAYVRSKAFPYLVTDREIGEAELLALANCVIEDDNSFFARREIIDEYGWRNFGELYADHEAVGHEGETPLISHYNNQYDCINGFLNRFAASGDYRWYLLADQLAGHVKDIDIYHTDKDRPEFNHGLFWHTNHYMDAGTATHRCYSKHQVKYDERSNYGGGPAMSHCYATGLLIHYYMTGCLSSRDSVLALGSFAIHNIEMDRTLMTRLVKTIKKFRNFCSRMGKDKERVQLTKIYGFDGPGRASGNALNTLMDAFALTGRKCYLKHAESLLTACVNPNDDIEKRDLLDVENRWMYTIFLQALVRYLDVKSESGQHDELWHYAWLCLVKYASWMVDNESLYLDNPDRLDYPNETWVTQEFRKILLFLYASRYCDEKSSPLLINKADDFWKKVWTSLSSFDTKDLNRPLILMIQNGFGYEFFKQNSLERIPHTPVEWTWKNQFHLALKRGNWSINFKTEYQVLKWRI